MLRADVLGDGASGEITLRDGTTHKFIAQASTGDAGVYYTLQDSRLAPELWGGWVIGNDGTQRGARKLRGQFQQTLPLTSSGVDIGGTTFAVARVGAAGGGVAVTRIAAPSSYSVPADLVLSPPPPAPFVPIPYPNNGVLITGRS